MLTIANQGGEGVKNYEKHANVICERPLLVPLTGYCAISLLFYKTKSISLHIYYILPIAI